MNKKIIEICIAMLLTMPLLDQLLIYYFKIPSPYLLFRTMLIVTPILILIIFKTKIKQLNNSLFLYGLYILINIIYLPLNFKDGIGYVIGILFIYLNLVVIYSIKDKISIFKILRYSILIITPLIIFNLFISFDISYYSHKHQFFGTYANANIFGIFLIFALTLIVLTKELINKYLNLLLLMIVFYLIMITISRSTMVASLPLFYLYFNNIKLKYILLLFISILLLFIMQDSFDVTKYIISRFMEPDSREHNAMFKLFEANSYLPSGPVKFHEDMGYHNVIPDNSYIELLYNYGFLGILYFIPFIYVYIIKKDNYLKILILPFFIQSIFERLLSTSITPINLLIFIIIFIYYNEISKVRKGQYEKNTNIHR